MRFRDQLRWCRKWGAILLLFSAAVLGVLVLLRETGYREAVLSWGDLVMLVVGAAIVLLVFGGLMRPFQKKMFHTVFEANESYRTRLAVNPVMRWLLWLDSEGRDRDA
jgi:CHASE2 domain-containing sensor protein